MQREQPHHLDWDENFPAGWHASDVIDATNRAYQRIPGTEHPSMDGRLYLDQGYNMLADGLQSSGWNRVIANDAPDSKNRTYAHTNFMFNNGQRHGPLATYLATAAARKSLFTMWTNTAANRIVRNGSHATGVEVSCSAGTGYSGTVNLTPGTGRVIVSAGTFGSPKLLFRSKFSAIYGATLERLVIANDARCAGGIGPTDQLTVVQGSSDGATMIKQSDWINLPVGYNLAEQMNVSISPRPRIGISSCF